MPNYTLLAIPAMWATAVVPHAYALGYIKKHNNGRWDNTNSKGQAFNKKLQTTLAPEVFARYERTEAASRNGFENLPLLAAGVLSVAWAEVDASWSVWTYIGLRIVYTLLYVNISTLKKSFARTATWGLSTLLCLSLFVRAALA